MSNDSSARFRRFRFHASALQGRGRGRKSRPVTSAENQIALPNVAKSQLDKPSRKPEPKRATVAFALSLAFHMLLGTCVVKLIHQHHMENQPFEESIQVRWVPPPSVRLKVRPREISKEIPKVFSTQQKAPSTPQRNWRGDLRSRLRKSSSKDRRSSEKAWKSIVTPPLARFCL